MKQKEIENLLSKAREAERILKNLDAGFELGCLIENSIVLYDRKLSVPWNEELPGAAYSGLEKTVLSLRDELAESVKKGDAKGTVRPLAVLIGQGYWQSNVDAELLGSQIKTMQDIARGYVGLGYSEAKKVTECLEGVTTNGSSYSGTLESSVIIEDLFRGRVRSIPAEDLYGKKAEKGKEKQQMAEQEKKPAKPTIDYDAECDRILEISDSAHRLYGAGRFAESKMKFEQIAGLNPQIYYPEREIYDSILGMIAEAHFNIGTCCSKMGNNREALMHYDAAVNMKPDPDTTSLAYYNMSIIYSMHEKPKEAAQAAKAALNANPFNKEAKEVLKWAESRMKQERNQRWFGWAGSLADGICALNDAFAEDAYGRPQYR